MGNGEPQEKKKFSMNVSMKKSETEDKSDAGKVMPIKMALGQQVRVFNYVEEYCTGQTQSRYMITQFTVLPRYIVIFYTKLKLAL